MPLPSVLLMVLLLIVHVRTAVSPVPFVTPVPPPMPFEALMLCAEMKLLFDVTVQSEKPLHPTRMTVPEVFVSGLPTVPLLETMNVPDERAPELPLSMAMAMASVPIGMAALLPEIRLPVMVMLGSVPAGPVVLELPPIT